jgi:hypothetical protein
VFDSEIELNDKHKMQLDHSNNRLLIIHACKNYIDALDYQYNKEKKQSLLDRLIETEKLYMFNYKELKKKSEQRFKEKLNENQFFNTNANYDRSILEWLSRAIESIEKSDLYEEFWNKIQNEFTVQKEAFNYKKSSNYKFEMRVYNKTIMTIQELKTILLEEFEKMLKLREKALDEMIPLFEKGGMNKFKGY